MNFINIFNAPIYHFKIIDSTNKFAKTLALENPKNGTIIIADEQTNGRGRFGNTWNSSKDNGLYYSIIFQKNNNNLKYESLTLFVSLAICKLIEQFSITPLIKWPNDILINNKKVCGILSECVLNKHGEFIVVGIGINLYHNINDFDKDIQNKATSIYLNTDKKINKEYFVQMLTEYIKEYYNYFLNYSFSDFLKEYENKSSILNKDISIILNNKQIIGKVLGFTSTGLLKIQTDKKILEISSGEVSLKNNYTK